MNTLIIGGTSGLGLELGKKLTKEGEVTVTGRHNPNADGINYKEFDLTRGELPGRIGELVMHHPEVDILIYAAGYYQEGTITELSDKEVDEMLDVGERGLIFFVKKLLEKQGSLKELITITSTSQWTPRLKEPVYNAAKAGAGHFSNGLSLDVKKVGKVLVAGPAGMNTAFWEGIERDDLDTMLDPEWVAGEIMKLRQDDYQYKFAKIMRQPARVEVVETR